MIEECLTGRNGTDDVYWKDIADGKMVVIHSVVVLPNLQKLVVATDDRQLIFYELLSHANAVRWAFFGKMVLKELPISLDALKDAIDSALASFSAHIHDQIAHRRDDSHDRQRRHDSLLASRSGDPPRGDVQLHVPS